MEDAPRPYDEYVFIVHEDGLNPCCNGRCSPTIKRPAVLQVVANVLILVVMEDAPRQEHLEAASHFRPVLILVVMEDAPRPRFRRAFGSSQ